MAKFCGKCGSRLDEQSGLCPKCSVENNTVEQQSEHSYVKLKENDLNVVSKNNSNDKLKQKKKRVILKILLIIVAIVLISISILFVLGYYGYINIPFITNPNPDTSNFDNNISDVVGNRYEYTEGENLSQFYVSEDKSASLMFWLNYGSGASTEDFFFDWEDDKWEYELKGNRSGKMYTITFAPTEKGMYDLWR